MTRRRAALFFGLAAGAGLQMLSGCGPTFGALLYHMNVVSEPEIPARFELTKGRLLVLVDDDHELLTWPSAQVVLIDGLAAALEQAEVNHRVVRSSELNTARQRYARFAEQSIAEIGRRLEAEQVLWIQVEEFLADRSEEALSNAARFTVRIKVFDPAEGEQGQRLWPDDRAGEYASVDLSPHEVQRYARSDDVARVLVEQMIQKIARFFYAHPAEPQE